MARKATEPKFVYSCGECEQDSLMKVDFTRPTLIGGIFWITCPRCKKKGVSHKEDMEMKRGWVKV